MASECLKHTLKLPSVVPRTPFSISVKTEEFSLRRKYGLDYTTGALTCIKTQMFYRLMEIRAALHTKAAAHMWVRLRHHHGNHRERLALDTQSADAVSRISNGRFQTVLTNLNPWRQW